MIILILIWLNRTDYSRCALTLRVALRAYPSGRPAGDPPPLRAVVEPSCFLSAVRIEPSIAA
jgi:hypothetical protein